MKNVKKFVYIINPGRFNNYSVISAHSHCDQFRPETPPVRLFVAPTGNHFKLTVISHQVLQKKHIYIYRTKIILKDASFHIEDREKAALIGNNGAGKTTLLIAHRISTVEGLDKIIFLEDGRVEAVGPHDRLYASCPEYHKMVDLQKLEDEVGGGNA